MDGDTHTPPTGGLTRKDDIVPQDRVGSKQHGTIRPSASRDVNQTSGSIISLDSGGEAGQSMARAPRRRDREYTAHFTHKESKADFPFPYLIRPPIQASTFGGPRKSDRD